MIDTNPTGRVARNQGSLLSRVEDWLAQHGQRLEDYLPLSQQGTDVLLGRLDHEQAEPAHDRPVVDRPVIDRPASHPGESRLLERLGREQTERGYDDPSPLVPVSQPPMEASMEETPLPEQPVDEFSGSGAAGSEDELPDFLRDVEHDYAERASDEPQAVFDQSQPLSPEVRHMLETGEIPRPPEEPSWDATDTEAEPEVAGVGPFTQGMLDPESLEDTRPVSTPMGRRVEEALARLREKMVQVATEFAEGKINQAQFQAIYSRYQEQRIITEQLLARDPTTDAWQSVLTEGHTTFLRHQYEARVLGYTLCDHQSGQTIVTHGHFDLPPDLLTPMLSSFYSATTEAFGSGMRSTVIEDGRWVVLVPGRYTTAIVIFSLQPSERQLRLVSDLHQDFEHANQPTLVSGDVIPDRLVYPQRFLLQDLDEAEFPGH